MPLTKAKNSYPRFLKEAIGYTKVRAPGRLKRDAPRPLLLYMKLFSRLFAGEDAYGDGSMREQIIVKSCNEKAFPFAVDAAKFIAPLTKQSALSSKACA